MQPSFHIYLCDQKNSKPTLLCATDTNKLMFAFSSMFNPFMFLKNGHCGYSTQVSLFIFPVVICGISAKNAPFAIIMKKEIYKTVYRVKGESAKSVNALSHNNFLWKTYFMRLTYTDLCVLQMYLQCRVNLCITTTPSQKCPNLCGRAFGSRLLVGSLFTKSYTVNSGPVSLVVTTAAPTTIFQATEASGTLSTGFTNSTSHGKVSDISI